MRKVGVFITLLLSNISFHAVAQNEVKHLTLDTYVEEVRNNNLSLQVSDNRSAISELAIKEAMAALLPQVSGQTGFKRYFDPQYTFFEAPDYENIDPVTGEIPETMQSFRVGFFNDFQAHAVLEQSLFSLQNIYELQSARAFATAGKLQEDQYTIELLAEAKKLFLQTVLMKKVYEVSVATAQLAEVNYNTTKNKYENKLISELDLLQAKILLDEESPKLLRAQRNYLILLENLKIIAGMDSEDSISVSYEFTEKLGGSHVLNPTAAIQNRIDYQLMESQVALQKRVLQVQKASYYPSLQFQLGYSYFSGSNEWTISENQNKFSYADLTLTAPIFTGGYRKNEVSKAQISLDNAELEELDAMRKMKVEIKNLELKLAEEAKAIAAAKTTLETSKKAHAIMLENANTGLGSQLDLRRMSNDARQAEIHYYTSIYQFECTQIDYQNAIANY